MMACIAPGSLHASVSFVSFKGQRAGQLEVDVMSACGIHEVNPQRAVTIVGSGRAQEVSRCQIQRGRLQSACKDFVHVHHHGGCAPLSAFGNGQLRNGKLSPIFEHWRKSGGCRYGGSGDVRDTRLLCSSLRIGDLVRVETLGKSKFYEKRWKPGDGAVSAIVSNSGGVSRQPQRGSPSGLKIPVSSDRNVPVPGGSSVNHREKLQVAVDVDEVLGFFVSTLNNFCAEEYRIQYHVSQYHIYDFKTVWGCSQEEANHRVHAFFGSKHFNQGIPPIPGAIQALLRLQTECHLVVVTSRQHVIRKPTLEWIDVHYPGIFKEVHFGNHYALEGVARPKSEICKSLGVEILIDDNPKYALECAEHGIEVLLFDWKDSYPWSKTDDGPVHPLITRVQDWVEVEEVLLARTSALEP
eukprot:TRINITY_DN3742_c0_g1_i1.p1 TRINITY_DN3742_c0_g1~~TRINITY_DN3742_c0_g1_i1.p1  ORF type:complete len:410 (+),score=60.99 TRINITY_DN3742_c0_g1_i1:138-1367(+)